MARKEPIGFTKANITDKADLISKLMDVHHAPLYYNRDKVFYDDKADGSPFRRQVSPTRNSPLTFEFDCLGYFNYKQKWYDNIPNKGVLCWVTDFEGDIGKETEAAVIVAMLKENSGEVSYHTKVNDWFCHARPVKPSECFKET